MCVCVCVCVCVCMCVCACVCVCMCVCVCVGIPASQLSTSRTIAFFIGCLEVAIWVVALGWVLPGYSPRYVCVYTHTHTHTQIHTHTHTNKALVRLRHLSAQDLHVCALHAHVGRATMCAHVCVCVCLCLCTTGGV